MSRDELATRLEMLQSAPSGEDRGAARESELQAVLHELEVYQIELEMQVRELRESRQALEESHDRYINLYDFAPVGYFTLTEKGYISEINLTAAGMLGVERQWLTDRALSPWIVPGDLPLYRGHLKQCRAGEGQVRTSLRLLRRDKRELPVELTTSCDSDPVTGAAMFRTAVVDLSERKKAEADLERFFQLSSDLLCIVDKDGRFMRVNPASENVLGYRPDELVSHSVFDFMHPDDSLGARRELLLLGFDGASVAGFQVRYLRKDRSVVWLSWSTQTSGGSLFCVARDVTDLVRAKEKAQNQYDWLTEVVENIPVPLTLIDPKSGSILSMSSISKSMFTSFPAGSDDFSSSENFCADPDGKRLPPAKWPRARVVKGEEIVDEPYLWMTSNGDARHVRVSSRNIPEKYGQQATAILVVQDVTRLRQMEDSLRESVVKLEKERELREHFVLALTHDLRTPLTGAKLGAQLMAYKAVNSIDTPNISAQIVKNIDRLDHMIRDLLDASRIQSGEGLPLNLSKIDLAGLAAEALEGLSAVYPDRFVLNAPAVIEGNWDKQDLRRVIENLATNAVKYGDPALPITIAVLRKSKHQVALTVHNFGNPIPAEEQAGLFDQFRRTAHAEKGGQKGWGIGLTLVKGIAEAHGGRLSVESSRGAGTTFRVLLPLGLSKR